MALFKMSQAELAEAFVRERFKEPLVFGKPDIEEWLHHEWISAYPRREVWRSLLSRDVRFQTVKEQQLFALLKHCCHADTIPLGTLEFEWPLSRMVREMLERPYIGSLLNKIDRDRVQLFLGEHCIILHEPNTVTPLVWTEHNAKLIPAQVSGRYVAGVLLSTWGRQTPCWYQARTALCELLLEDIAQEKMKARKEYDRAVAVRKDGTAIIHADEVWVFEGRDITRVKKFSAPQFFERKILCKPNLIGAHGSPTVEGVFSMTGWDENTQMLFAGDGPNRRVFITHRKFCPDPLPEPMPAPVTA